MSKPPGPPVGKTGDSSVEPVDSATELSAELGEDELPVVARLVVEIRSDGSRTIARGAMEDVATEQRVAIEARGDSPLQLAWALARSMFAAPALARKTARALLPGRRRGGRWRR